jgi:hypothetical protein
VTRPSKQLLLKLGAFLLLGAIVNVAAAWASWLFSRNESVQPVVREVAWEQLKSHFGADFKLAVDGTFFGVVTNRRGISDLYCFAAQHNGSVGLHVIDAGWPVFSLRGEVLLRASTWECRSCISIGSDSSWRRWAPARPIWPGFAINTIFYAAILWLLWIARRTPGKIRRFIRVRRGRCPACGYQIAEGVGPRCSECGHALGRVAD